MMVRVNIKNQNSKRKISLAKLKLAAEKILKLLKKNNAELNIMLVTSQKIRVFKRVYFGKDTSTDVIAFPARSARRDYTEICERNFLGDIIISLDRAVKNTKIYRTTFFDETLLYVIHGILHLDGYRDKTNRDRSVMRRKEIELIQKIGKISE
ncbi:MAG: rRNA maturation RNase YbeY [Candidatus Omnitrophota bacterium]